jgi:hypothetical protein
MDYSNPLAWYEKIDKYLRSSGFHINNFDHNLYIKEKEEEIIIMVEFVGDLIIIGNSFVLMKEEKYNRCKSFDMT